MIWSRETSSSQTTGFHAKISTILLHHDIGRHLGLPTLAMGVAGLVLIFGFCLLLGGAVVSTAGDPLFGPGDMMGVGSALRFLGTMAMINGILGILLGGCGISSGIGILMRRSWARTLGMITAGMAALMAVLEIIRIVGGFLRLPSSWPGKGVGITLGIIDFLILLSFALFSFIALAA